MRERISRLARSPALRALLGGLLLSMGAPPFPPALIAFAFVGVALLASALEDARFGQAIVRGLLFGLATNLVAMSFVPQTITRFTDLPLVAALAGWVLLAVAQGGSWAVAGALAWGLARVGAPRSLAFGAGVGASMLVPSLFPWTIAAPFARAPVFLQPAELIGERGMAVVFAIAAALVAMRARKAIVAAGAILAALLVYGLARRPSIDAARAAAPSRSIALVQQNVPPKDRWKHELAPAIVSKLWSLTRLAQERGAELAIWPESAYPYVLSADGGRETGAFRVRGPGIGIEVLTGVLTDAPPPPGAEPGSRWSFNSATIVDLEGNYAPAAAKLELLAFGEVVPLADRFPTLRRTFARGGGLVAGRDPLLLRTKSPGPEVRSGILNCYEDTLPSISRRIARAAPNLLVNLTNDAWFGATAEPELHLLEAIPRAIEARRDLLRAVNTGVTVHVDAYGTVVARATREVATILMVRPALLEGPPTVYVRFGDWTWGAPLLLALLATIARARR
ncbi:MAG: apolipoprotein N-acyltransferase [Deltaproteobacteria bacterium]|nr:apolipoprotein N-acyltransferase [Deltaproteobacteria bacterium]